MVSIPSVTVTIGIMFVEIWSFGVIVSVRPMTTPTKSLSMLALVLMFISPIGMVINIVVSITMIELCALELEDSLLIVVSTGGRVVERPRGLGIPAAL